jgi:hypothetical protein
MGVSAGTPTNNTLTLSLKKAGVVISGESVILPGVDGSYRTMGFSTDLTLAAGDEIKVDLQVTVGTGSGTWEVGGTAQTSLSGFLVKTT